MAIKLPRFLWNLRLVNEDGSPTSTFHQWWEKVTGAVEKNEQDIEINTVSIETINQFLEVFTLANPAASTDVADFRIPITLDGDVYYILLKKA